MTQSMFDHHRELLDDETRTNAFRAAIHRVVQRGDVVVDLGCGSGILSFFACEAGASRVYAIEATHAADAAQLLARHLGLHDRITVLHADARDIELPDRADVLVTETLGVLGLDEGICGLVEDARQRFLKPGARIVPGRVAISITPVELEHDYARHVAFWSEERYGLDLSPLRRFASNSVVLAHIHTRSHLAEPMEVLAVDFARQSGTAVSGRAVFQIRRDAQFHGFGGFFNATLAEGIALSNRDARTTSWSQAFLPLEQPIAVHRGSQVEVELETDDGQVWHWRGCAGNRQFEQTTRLAEPACLAQG